MSSSMRACISSLKSDLNRSISVNTEFVKLDIYFSLERSKLSQTSRWWFFISLMVGSICL
ncbi:hypothetical protein HPNQ4200_0802 [Helicobacter pylori NQ4200]|uniref:Uncharacterized protein n=1 Tax=Helicobacter pylori NQ4200 TaxID=992024 RepID=I9Q523_HELPX|nr:hypothetical protein HPNQ4200_0802 [Helicobacter pylori NQ4200]